MTKKEAYREFLEECGECSTFGNPTEEDCQNCSIDIAIKVLRKEIEYSNCCEYCKHSIPVETGLLGWEYSDECYGCRWRTDLKNKFEERIEATEDAE